jgi:hypothetical protein
MNFFLSVKILSNSAFHFEKLSKFQIVWKYFNYLTMFFFHKLQKKFNVMYITPLLHAIKDFWNLKLFFNRFLIFKILKFLNF